MDKKTIGLGLLGAVIVIALGVYAGFSFSVSKVNPIGSVEIANEYQATSTLSAIGVAMKSGYTFVNGSASVGSVVITGAATGVVNLYNATTSNVLLRGASFATSSLTYINIPASLAVGTYTFDMVFDKGIVIEIVGTAPTSTITYRKY